MVKSSYFALVSKTLEVSLYITLFQLKNKRFCWTFKKIKFYYFTINMSLVKMSSFSVVLLIFCSFKIIEATGPSSNSSAVIESTNSTLDERNSTLTASNVHSRQGRGVVCFFLGVWCDDSGKNSKSANNPADSGDDCEASPQDMSLEVNFKWTSGSKKECWKWKRWALMNKKLTLFSQFYWSLLYTF